MRTAGAWRRRRRSGAPLEPVHFTRRADDRLSQLRSEQSSARPGRTLLLHDGDGTRWYTFAGLRANLELAARLAPLRTQISQRNNVFIAFGTAVDRCNLRAAIQQPTPETELARLVANASGALKLQQVLPAELVEQILIARLRDTAAVSQVVEASIDESTATEAPRPRRRGGLNPPR